MLLSTDSLIGHFDLSDDSLRVFPDLSAYAIRSLDMSHNQIDSFETENLPRSLEVLNISHNNLTKLPDMSTTSISELNFSHNKLSSFRNDHLPERVRNLNCSYNKLTEDYTFYWDAMERHVLNLSHNKIESFGGSFIIDSLILSNNNLKSIHMGGKVNYLDISDNPEMPNIIFYLPELKIKELRRNNIGNENPIEYIYKKNYIKFLPM